MPFDGEHDTVRIQVINLANERLMFDRTFVLISEADCCFNREFYYNASDYDGAEFYADIDDFHEVVPFLWASSSLIIKGTPRKLCRVLPKPINKKLKM